MKLSSKNKYLKLIFIEKLYLLIVLLEKKFYVIAPKKLLLQPIGFNKRQVQKIYEA